MGGKGLQRKLRKNKTEENNTDFDRLDRWVGVDPYAGRRIKTKEKRKLAGYTSRFLFSEHANGIWRRLFCIRRPASLV